MRARAGIEHELALAAELLIYFKKKTDVACPAVVFNSCHETGQFFASKAIKKTMKSTVSIGAQPPGGFCGATKKLKESPKIAEEFGIWSVVAIFKLHILVPADLEDLAKSRPRGQLLSVKNGVLCSVITISGCGRDEIRDVQVFELQASG